MERGTGTSHKSVMNVANKIRLTTEISEGGASHTSHTLVHARGGAGGCGVGGGRGGCCWSVVCCVLWLLDFSRRKTARTGTARTGSSTPARKGNNTLTAAALLLLWLLFTAAVLFLPIGVDGGNVRIV